MEVMQSYPVSGLKNSSCIAPQPLRIRLGMPPGQNLGVSNAPPTDYNTMSYMHVYEHAGWVVIDSCVAISYLHSVLVTDKTT